MAIEVGSKVTGKVTGITRFGAFVTLPEGETGLVHISEISDDYVRDVNDYLKVNDEVTVKVLSVSGDGKIALSIRQANESSSGRAHRGGSRGGQRQDRRQGFEQIMNRFLKDSEERLAQLRRSEAKRGGRGGRRG
ncbi:S1 domain-containing RNA-binding protein [Alicyclobacillus fructus]|uniref:S1 domain-containing RNA-binding protein n=1 Tax=Alicyclobacillus fructus TaxID=2816082 RepID=UPI001A8DCF68|nr:S1 domain-containing RNA-binding protein [Alicyclobacillus fructus]